MSSTRVSRLLAGDGLTPQSYPSSLVGRPSTSLCASFNIMAEDGAFDKTSLNTVKR